MIVNIIHMYNSKHPCTWDESLPYVQHSYNQALHSSTDHSPFQVGLGFQPLGPIDVALPLAVTSEVAEQLTPTELNPNCLQQASNDHIVNRQIKGTQQPRIQLYRVVKAGQCLHQGKWLTLSQI